MRTLYCVILFVAAIQLSLYGNPVETPIAFFSELKFDQQGSWILEISFSSTLPFSHEKYDSICVESSAGTTKLNLDKINAGATLFVISPDSLETPLFINKSGDVVRICTFTNGWLTGIDSVCFGSYPNSTISYLPDGYSISKTGQFGFCSLDKTPTIGEVNDTSGMFGTLSGSLYDKNNNLVTNGQFVFDEKLLLDGSGNYTVQIYGCNNIFGRITNAFNEHSSKIIRIDTIEINAYPDSLYKADIHLHDDYVVGVSNELITTDYEIKVANYPNPFNASTNFILSVPSILQNESKAIIIYNSNGQKIRTLDAAGINKLQWDGRNEEGSIVSSGVYYYSLVSGLKVYANGSMILLK